MTTLTASQVRLGPHFNRVAYQGDVLHITHRGGESVYVVSQNDWELIQEAKQMRATAVRAASQRVGERHYDTMRQLAQ